MTTTLPSVEVIRLDPRGHLRGAGWRGRLEAVPWWWVVVAGVAIYLVTSPLLSVAISVYAGFLELLSPFVGTDGRPEAVAQALRGWGQEAISLLLVAAAAALLASVVRSRPVQHALVLGGTVAACNVIAAIMAEGRPGPIDFAGVLAVAAGWIGGRLGGRDAVAQEALYRASQAVAAAPDPQAIVLAGAQLAGPEVERICLWSLEPGESRELVRLAAWQSQAAHGHDLVDATRMAAPQGVDATTPVVLQWDYLTTEERERWGHLGGMSTLVAPLVTPAGEWTGALTVESRADGGFRESDLRVYLTLAAQASVALENVRLLEQVRHAAVLEERERMAREIHDTLAQGFTSIVMHLQAAEASLAQAPPPARHHLEQARETARESLAESRRLVWALRPESLERGSLAETLERLTAEWSREHGIPAHFEATGDAQSLHPQVEVTLLRAAQESLANVRRHANASEVNVTLSYMDDVVILDVQDDGAGLASGEERAAGGALGGFGLTAMRGRAEQLGGTLTIESAPGEGVTLTVALPLRGSGE